MRAGGCALDDCAAAVLATATLLAGALRAALGALQIAVHLQQEPGAVRREAEVEVQGAQVGDHVAGPPALDAGDAGHLAEGEAAGERLPRGPGGELGQERPGPVHRVLALPGPGRVGRAPAEGEGRVDRAEAAELDPVVGGLEAQGQRRPAELGDELRREALAASEEALRLDPSLAEAHVARANLMSLAGRPAEAEEEFRRATTLNPGLASAWYFQGRFFLAAGRMAEGALALEEAARCDPEDYNAVTLLPQAYRALGDRAREASAGQRAAVVSERWARLNPDDVRALYCAGGNMVRSGEVERGLALVERALELEPDDSLGGAQEAMAFGGPYDR